MFPVQNAQHLIHIVVFAQSDILRIGQIFHGVDHFRIHHKHFMDFFLYDFLMFKYKVNIFHRYQYLFMSKAGSRFIYEREAIRFGSVNHNLLASGIQQLFNIFQTVHISAAACRNLDQAVQFPNRMYIFFVFPVFAGKIKDKYFIYPTVVIYFCKKS